jgi:hypothetical protein
MADVYVRENGSDGAAGTTDALAVATMATAATVATDDGDVYYVARGSTVQRGAAWALAHDNQKVLPYTSTQTGDTLADDLPTIVGSYECIGLTWAIVGALTTFKATLTAPYNVTATTYVRFKDASGNGWIGGKRNTDLRGELTSGLKYEWDIADDGSAIYVGVPTGTVPTHYTAIEMFYANTLCDLNAKDATVFHGIRFKNWGHAGATDGAITGTGTGVESVYFYFCEFDCGLQTDRAAFATKGVMTVNYDWMDFYNCTVSGTSYGVSVLGSTNHDFGIAAYNNIFNGNNYPIRVSTSGDGDVGAYYGGNIFCGVRHPSIATNAVAMTAVGAGTEIRRDMGDNVYFVGHPGTVTDSNYSNKAFGCGIIIDGVGRESGLETYAETVVDECAARGLPGPTISICPGGTYWTSAIATQVQEWINKGADVVNGGWAGQVFLTAGEGSHSTTLPMTSAGDTATAFTIFSTKDSGSSSPTVILNIHEHEADHLKTWIGTPPVLDLDLDLTDPAYDTIGELVAYINAQYGYNATLGTYAEAGALSVSLAEINDIPIRREAFNLEYTGSGSACTATVGSDLITTAVTAAEAFDIEYAGSGSACTGTITGDLLTTAVTAADAFDIQYTDDGATGTCTITGDVLTTALTSADALDLQYTGDGATGTVTVAANVLTTDLTLADAFSFDYTGTAAAATVTIAANVLTTALTTSDGFDIQYTGDASAAAMDIGGNVLDVDLTAAHAFALSYTGADAQCTYTVAANVLTTQIGGAGTHMSFDLTLAQYDTLGELIAAIDAESDYTCTIDAGALASWPSTGLVAIAAQDIQAGPHNATWTGEGMSLDLTHADYNTVGEVVAHINGLADYTCTIDAEGQTGWASTGLVAAVAQDIKTGVFAQDWTGTDISYDLTAGAYNTLTKICTLLDARSVYTATLDADMDGTEDSSDLINQAAQDITAPFAMHWSGEHVNIDLTAGATNTITELVAVLNGYNGYTCTINHADFNGWDASGLDAIAAQDIKAGAFTMQWSGTDLNLDLTNALYDTVAELVAVITAKSSYTATITHADYNLWPTTGLVDIAAQDVKTGAFTITYTGTDLSYDLTIAANDTVAELVALIHAKTDYTCTITHADYNLWPTTGLVDIAAEDIMTATFTITYTGTDLSVDISVGTETMTTLVAALTAKADYTCTIDPEADATLDANTLQTFTAESIASGYDLLAGNYSTLWEEDDVWANEIEATYTWMTANLTGSSPTVGFWRYGFPRFVNAATRANWQKLVTGYTVPMIGGAYPELAFLETQYDHSQSLEAGVNVYMIDTIVMWGATWNPTDAPTVKTFVSHTIARMRQAGRPFMFYVSDTTNVTTTMVSWYLNAIKRYTKVNTLTGIVTAVRALQAVRYDATNTTVPVEYCHPAHRELDMTPKHDGLCRKLGFYVPGTHDYYPLDGKGYTACDQRDRNFGWREDQSDGSALTKKASNTQGAFLVTFLNPAGGASTCAMTITDIAISTTTDVGGDENLSISLVGSSTANSTGYVAQTIGWASRQLEVELEAFTLTYSGTGTSCLLSISSAGLLTTTCAGAPTDNLSYDLTAGSYNTVKKIVDVIHLVANYTCVINASRTTTTDSIILKEYAALAITSSGTALHYKPLYSVDRGMDVDWDAPAIHLVNVTDEDIFVGTVYRVDYYKQSMRPDAGAIMFPQPANFNEGYLGARRYEGYLGARR